MAKIVYPLEEVIIVKKRRVDDAERVLSEKKEALKREEEKLKQREAERDKVQEHRNAKLQQMRDEMDHGTTGPKIIQMKVYIEVVKEKLKIEEKKVEDQKKQVKTAENEVEAAKEELRKRRNEVEKLVKHRVDWLKMAQAEQEVIDQRELDEVGSQMFLNFKAKSKRR